MTSETIQSYALRLRTKAKELKVSLDDSLIIKAFCEGITDRGLKRRVLSQTKRREVVSDVGRTHRDREGTAEEEGRYDRSKTISRQLLCLAQRHRYSRRRLLRRNLRRSKKG